MQPDHVGTGNLTPERSCEPSDTDEPGREPGEKRRRPDLIGRGAAVGYTGAYREPSGVDIQDVVAMQTARGPV
jgi:hypothetical protein